MKYAGSIKGPADLSSRKGVSKSAGAEFPSGRAEGARSGRKTAKFVAYVAFSLLLAAACYRRHSQDDFDRYVYEALIRSRTQSTENIYSIVKHSSPRAEDSSVMNSPEHLGELEPLYAVRPVYIILTTLVSRSGLSPQASINLVSAVSLFFISVVVCLATGNYLCSALVMMMPAVVTVGRIGTPDALSSLAVVAGCVLVLKDKLLAGILLLMLSIFVRTDNILIVAIVLGWLAWNGKVSALCAGVLVALGVASVEWINVLSGNYGWRVLFHYSFIGGKYPAEIIPQISLGQYAHVFAANAELIAPQLAPWLLLGVAAWILRPAHREFLAPIAAGSLLHYILFPSSESRYLTWAFLLTAILFVRALANPENRLIRSWERKL
jgi:hypothetical protein